MKIILPIILLAITSCSIEIEVVPECTSEYYTIKGKTHLQIDSQSDYVMLCRDSGRCTKIVSHYFSCISLSTNKGDILTIIDGDKTCQMVVTD